MHVGLRRARANVNAWRAHHRAARNRRAASYARAPDAYADQTRDRCAHFDARAHRHAHADSDSDRCASAIYAADGWWLLRESRLAARFGKRYFY